MSRYPKLANYEPFTIDTDEEFLRFACCDCGMVHDWHLKIDKRYPDRVIAYYVSLPRATAQLRRHGYGNLQKPRKGYRLIK